MFVTSSFIIILSYDNFIVTASLWMIFHGRAIFYFEAYFKDSELRHMRHQLLVVIIERYCIYKKRSISSALLIVLLLLIRL